MSKYLCKVVSLQARVRTSPTAFAPAVETGIKTYFFSQQFDGIEVMDDLTFPNSPDYIWMRVSHGFVAIRHKGQDQLSYDIIGEEPPPTEDPKDQPVARIVVYGNGEYEIYGQPPKNLADL